MKKSIIYLAIMIVALVLASCEKDNVLRLEEYGYIKTSAKVFSNLTGKSVPVCSDEFPETILYVVENEDGFVYTETASITDSQNFIYPNEEIRLPVGNYRVTDISLLSGSGTVTHRVPNREISGFDFSGFVDVSTPFDITILPEEETLVESEFLCYTSEILELSGSVDAYGRILPLQTLYFRIPEGDCMERLTIIVYNNFDEADSGRKIVDIPISGRGIRGVPILKEFQYMNVTAWTESNIIETVRLNEYNEQPEPDGSIVLNLEDVVEFKNCD